MTGFILLDLGQVQVWLVLDINKCFVVKCKDSCFAFEDVDEATNFAMFLRDIMKIKNSEASK